MNLVKQGYSHSFQILLWGVLWLLLYLISADFNIRPFRLGRTIIVSIGLMFTCWVNLKFLFPRFFIPKKYTFYILSSILLIILMSIAMDSMTNLWGQYFTNGKHFPFPTAGKIFRVVIVVPFIMALVGSSLIEISLLSHKKDAEKLQLELLFLKSQINPHFLFNSLNNIYTLVLLKSDNAAPNLMKLSKMLRYLLYDCSDERVSLSQEINYIHNYLDLVKLKDSKGLNIISDLSVTQPDIQIAPMIFITFIENAFKHSKIEDLDNGWIKLKIKAIDNTVLFTISNSIPDHKPTNNRVGGIGLQNVKRQLDVLYPKKHQLNIQQNSRKYSVTLEIITNG